MARRSAAARTPRAPASRWSAAGKASERCEERSKQPPAPKALAYKVLGYPHLSMALILGRVYTLAELETRCGNSNKERRTLLYKKLADRSVFRPVSLSAAFRQVEARDDLPVWARGPVVCPSADDKEVIQRRRRVADSLAKMLQQSGGRRISDKDMLQVLKAWGFHRNNARKNVLPAGKEWVHSDTLGLVRSRDGRTIMAGPSRVHPHFTRLLLVWLRGHWPKGLPEDFPITSISVNSQYAARRHRDGSNAGPSLIRALGSFRGGQLRYWPGDPGQCRVETLRPEDAVSLNVRGEPVTFDGNRAHEVTDYTGERFSLVFFTVGHWWKTAPPARTRLKRLGFTFPTKEALATAQKYVVKG